MFRISVICLVAGCASSSSLQRPDVIGAGKFTTGVGIEGSATTYPIVADNDSQSPTGLALQPVLWTRLGLSDRIELTSHLWLGAGLTASLKAQITAPENKFIVSFSGGGGYFFHAPRDGHGESYGRLTVASHLGWQVSDRWLVYASPKYQYDRPSDLPFRYHSMGASVGIGIGSGRSFLLEATAMKDLDGNELTLMGAIGVEFSR